MSRRGSEGSFPLINPEPTKAPGQLWGSANKDRGLWHQADMTSLCSQLPVGEEMKCGHPRLPLCESAVAPRKWLDAHLHS